MIVPEHLAWSIAALLTGMVAAWLALFFVCLMLRNRVRTLEIHVQELRWMRRREEKTGGYVRRRPRSRRSREGRRNG